MGQSSRKMLIYALVARGTPPEVVAEYTEFGGNFISVAFQCLLKLPSSNNKSTYNFANHTFNYLVHDGFTYCVVAEETVGREIPMTFLDLVKDDFVANYSRGEAATAPLDSLNKDFGPRLKEHMQFFIEHPEDISKLAKVQAEVSEIKGVMIENIEKVLDRGQKIEVLVEKTRDLLIQAQEYKIRAAKTRRRTWRQNLKLMLIVLAILMMIIIVVIIIIVLSVCKGLHCMKILPQSFNQFVLLRVYVTSK